MSSCQHSSSGNPHQYVGVALIDFIVPDNLCTDFQCLLLAGLSFNAWTAQCLLLFPCPALMTHVQQQKRVFDPDAEQPHHQALLQGTN